MIRLKFNRNFKTIELIMNSGKTRMPVHIMYGGLLVDDSDIETVGKILDRNLIKYKLK